jgi:hypothetical protein
MELIAGPDLAEALDVPARAVSLAVTEQQLCRGYPLYDWVRYGAEGEVRGYAVPVVARLELGLPPFADAQGAAPETVAEQILALLTARVMNELTAELKPWLTELVADRLGTGGAEAGTPSTEAPSTEAPSTSSQETPSQGTSARDPSSQSASSQEGPSPGSTLHNPSPQTGSQDDPPESSPSPASDSASSSGSGPDDDPDAADDPAGILETARRSLESLQEKKQQRDESSGPVDSGDEAEGETS